MVTDLVTSWRPASWLLAQRLGTAAPDRDLPPRASGRMVGDALACRGHVGEQDVEGMADAAIDKSGAGASCGGAGVVLAATR